MNPNNPTQSAQPAPTPFSYWPDSYGDYAIENAKGEPIATVISRNHSDAQFILRACNSHAQLVAALETVTDLAYRLAMKAPDLNPEVDRIIPQARAALSAAKE